MKGDKKEKQLGLKVLMALKEYSQYMTKKDKDLVICGRYNYFIIDLPNMNIQRRTNKPNVEETNFK